MLSRLLLLVPLSGRRLLRSTSSGFFFWPTLAVARRVVAAGALFGLISLRVTYCAVFIFSFPLVPTSVTLNLQRRCSAAPLLFALSGSSVCLIT